MNRTWELMQEMRNVYKTVYLEHKVTDLNGFDTSTIVSIPMEYPRFLIKTVRVVPAKPTNCALEVRDSVVSAPTVLYSNDAEYSTGNFVEGIYDMVDIPYFDEDGTKSLHFKLTNHGQEVNNFFVIVTGLTIRE